MEFYVDIKKKLPGFELNVKLTSGQEIIGILGASGSGKSMLLRCIAGLVKPDEGKIIVNGKTFFDSEKQINLRPRDRKVGFLFQNYALFPHLTIGENIAFGLDDLSKPDKKQRVLELLEKFHLSEMEKRYPAQISGGQQQRVALARAMAVEPDIILLDEPFSALDEHLKNQMMKEMLTSLKEFPGSTLYVTHNMEEAYSLCDHIAILNAGNIETFRQKKELFKRPDTLETAKITGYKNLAKATRKSDYLVEISEWGIQVRTNLKVESAEGFIGIRANKIKLAEDSSKENCFPVWIADESETPFRTILYLKIGSAPLKAEDYHLQWELSQDQRQKINNSTKQLFIYIDPLDIFFIQK